MDEPLPTSRKVLDVQGEAQVNEDGVNRQYELLRCEPGEPVTLRRDPGNPFDANTILVLSAREVPIGRLTSQYAAMLAPLLDRGRKYRAKLHTIRGGVPDFPNFGARISIAWDDRPGLPHIPLDKAQQRFRARRRRRWKRWRGFGPVNGAQSDARIPVLVGLALLFLFALGALLADRIASAWCWAC